MKDSNLVFLISQPRSGSSLLQQLISTHPEVATAPEPWQMLSLFYTLKIHDNLDGYNPKFAAVNYGAFLESLPNGKKETMRHLLRLALENYNQYRGDAHYFLDKTPRYYHILEELITHFPDAKFVILVRNPMAVFSSILSYNFKGDLPAMLKRSDRLDDLFLAPKVISAFIEKHSNHCLISYESLVKNPVEIMSSVWSYLGLADIKTDAYELGDRFKETTSVDTKNLHKHEKAVTDYIDSWKQAIDTSQKKRVAIEFLQQLKENQSNYHYDIDSIISEVKKLGVKKRYLPTISLRLLSTKDENLSTLEVVKKRVLQSL